MREGRILTPFQSEHDLVSRHRRNPQAIAQWRHDHIEEALATPTADVRGPVVRAQARPPVVWPNGQTKAISLATLYRWMKRFRQGGLAALRPARRKDAGKRRAKLPADVLGKAFALLAADPESPTRFWSRFCEPTRSCV